MRASWLAVMVVAAGCGGGSASPSPSPSAATPSVTVTAAASASPSVAATSPPAAPPPPPHVMVIVLENRESSAVLGSGSGAPYLNFLAQHFTLLADWYGVAHPSLPNYLALVSGSTQGVTDDGTGYQFSGPTLVDQLSGAGIDWRAYLEGLPSNCWSGAASGRYAKKHDPFVYFASVLNNPQQCARVQPLGSNLGTDLNSAVPPPFMWITPDLCHDGHDCGNSVMDAWVQQTMTGVIASRWYQQGGVVVITFDEGSSSAGIAGGYGGHIATVVVSAHAQGTLPQAGDHYGTLRGIEELYGLQLLGAAANAAHGDLRTAV